MADAKPVIAVDDDQLRTRGFTESGRKNFTETVRDYAEELLEKAVHLGDADKAQGMPAEITHEHVRGSAHAIARSFGTPARPKWAVATQVTEYMATALAGVGGGHLDKQAGIIAFALGVSVAVILVVVRLTQSRSE